MIALCRVSELAHESPVVIRCPPQRSIILLALEKKIVAFRNICPHAGYELAYCGSMIRSDDGLHIKCNVHSAIFRQDDGICLSGPCKGEQLAPVELSIREGVIFAATGGTCA